MFEPAQLCKYLNLRCNSDVRPCKPNFQFLRKASKPQSKDAYFTLNTKHKNLKLLLITGGNHKG